MALILLLIASVLLPLLCLMLAAFAIGMGLLLACAVLGGLVELLCG